EVHGETEPEPQLGDVHGEQVVVHAVEVILNDLQLAAVYGDSVQAAGGKERFPQPQQFLHHAEQVGAATAGGIAYLDLTQRIQDNLGIREAGRVAIIHEPGDCGFLADRTRA